MVFYNSRVSIADVNGKEIYLIRNIKDELILNYYSLGGDIEELIVADNVLDEFDVLIYDDSIYLVYQDREYNLNLSIMKGKNKDTYKLTTEGFPKVLELNIIKHNDNISMIYLYPIDNRSNILQIEHHMLKGKSWHNYLVDQARVNQVLNPIKLIHKKGIIFLAYYYEEQICIKSFDENQEDWKESIVLTDNREKLYLDLIYDDDFLHLVYSEAIEGNYMIKYKMFQYDNSFIETYEANISLKSNASNPTIIKNNHLLWIVWNESSRIYSRYSDDHGWSWSEIKSWDESIKSNIVRYKYTSNIKSKSRIIDHTFGTIYPDIRFIGFY